MRARRQSSSGSKFVGCMFTAGVFCAALAHGCGSSDVQPFGPGTESAGTGGGPNDGGLGRGSMGGSDVLSIMTGATGGTSPGVGAGGSKGPGGTGTDAATGGEAPASGGQPGTGGARSGTGGRTSTGGMVGSGGAHSGGAPGSGGTAASTGGRWGTGGAVSGTGGAPASSGGAPPSGGAPGSGGAPSSGGTPGSGGAPSSGGAPGSGGDSGGTTAECQKLIEDYDSELPRARECSPKADDRCGMLVPAKLAGCGSTCTTYVDKAKMLDAIQRKWMEAGCTAPACPLSICVNPRSSTCLDATNMCSDSLL